MNREVSPKLLVVLVVLLVALSVASGVRGAVRDPSATLQPPPAWIGSFRGLIATPRPVQTQDVGSASPGECADLLAGTPLTITQSCELEIVEASDRVRALSLQSLSGNVQVVYVSSDPDQPPLKPTLKPDGDGVALQVPKDGGRLTITCGSSSCVITVGE